MILLSLTFLRDPDIGVIRRYECGGSAARPTHEASVSSHDFTYEDLDYFRTTPHSDYAVKTAYPCPAVEPGVA